jgi:hypothetical protein
VRRSCASGAVKHQHADVRVCLHSHTEVDDIESAQHHDSHVG